jgi:N-acetylglucosamine-6-phosphate deacetylase
MAELTITGATVLRGDQWVDSDLVCRDGLIVDGPPTSGRDSRPIDGAGLLVAPGFVDLQCNGSVGIDVTSDPAGMWELGAALPRFGVTAWLPTVVTAPPGAIDAAIAAWTAGPPPGWRGAVPLGLHLEGPFLSPTKRGAHREEHLRVPTLAAVDGWTRERGVAVVTLAPDLDGADDVLTALVERGVVVSLGHTPATAAQARGAVDAGATWVTHLFNAMAPLHHRAPGLAGVALADERVRVGLIADGVHVAPEVVAVAQRALGPRLTLVTDAVAAAGAPDAPDEARLADGTLAGSTLTMDQAVRNLVAFTGCRDESALSAASAAPAAVLGEASRGRLEHGRRADLVLLTRGLDVVATWVGGQLVHGPADMGA